MSDLILPTDEQQARVLDMLDAVGAKGLDAPSVAYIATLILLNKDAILAAPVSESFIAQQLEPAPIALTDQHVASLERAIRAEGFDIRVDTETGEVKLYRARDRDRAAVAAMHNIRLPSEVDAIAKKLDRAQDEE